ncbi:acylphosphatase-1-like isoform X2 [Oratosquilla oratoria]|uniref:acylphosphatase-1-like isoform X2 n=1 Tax=Oratosquilla oratoria TaxID=337810 RepID=UPI003F75F68F
MAKLIAVDFEVFGRVQGVFFRKYTQAKGKELKLVGWCRNTNRDTVQGQIEGPADAVVVMKDWLRNTGSPSSRITKAEFRNEKEIEAVSFSHFNIKH